MNPSLAEEAEKKERKIHEKMKKDVDWLNFFLLIPGTRQAVGGYPIKTLH